MLLLPKRLWMKVKTVSSIKGLWDLYFPCHALILLYPFRSQSTAVDSWVRILVHDLSCINYVWSENIYNKMHLSHRNYKEPTYICRRNTNLTTFISFFVSFSLSLPFCVRVNVSFFLLVYLIFAFIQLFARIFFLMSPPHLHTHKRIHIFGAFWFSLTCSLCILCAFVCKPETMT